MTTATNRLTPAQCHAYRRDGFVRGGPVFAADEFERIRERILHLLAGRAAGVDSERMLNPHLDEPWLLELAGRPEIVDRVAQLIGPDLTLFNTRILCKPPRVGRTVPWHQDAPYWPLDPPLVTTFWLAIDDVTKDNGALRLLPRHHRGGALEHVSVSADANVFDEAIRPDLVDESCAEFMTMQRGGCSFHDGFTPHSSGPNLTSERRCAFIARYIPTQSRLRRSERQLYGEDYPLHRVRGAPASP